MLRLASPALFASFALACTSTASVAVEDVCNLLANTLSPASDVYWPGSTQYAEDTAHWASSSSADAVCSVEPGTPDDVGAILQALGKTRTPFAIKGGGHATNPGFSSTNGVQITMNRFRDVVYDPVSQTVEYGTGLLWGEVYEALDQYHVNVVGGRIGGVGVAGLSLGGGYSWLTNQYGLTVDNIMGFKIVLPNGTVADVTESNGPDLFFSVMGGYNNFGIVTGIRTKAYPQGEVWGGYMLLLGDPTEIPWVDLNAATAKFQSDVTDPKAQLLPAYNILDMAGSPVGAVTVLMFYDGLAQPKGIFDDFFLINSPSVYILSDFKTSSFSDFVKSIPDARANGVKNTRALFHTVSLTAFDTEVLAIIANETQNWANELFPHSATFVSYDLELFAADHLAYGHAGSTAYPPSRTGGLLPLNLYFSWEDSADDERMHVAARESVARIQAAAVAAGQDVAGAPVYGNYALKDTPVEEIFGASLPRMQETKRRVDPEDVMGLAGGWKVPVGWSGSVDTLANEVPMSVMAVPDT